VRAEQIRRKASGILVNLILVVDEAAFCSDNISVSPRQEEALARCTVNSGFGMWSRVGTTTDRLISCDVEGGVREMPVSLVRCARSFR
jgi:hypothetical protein